MKLLSPGASNPKTAKSERLGYETAILHLAPHTQSGYNLCPSASEGCANACLYHQGRGRMDSVQTARIRKSVWYIEERDTFLEQLRKDIVSLMRRADRKGRTPCVRLNGTSDIRWERHGIMEEFPELQFYDYTKHANRWEIPDNYHLTFSRSECNAKDAVEALSRGRNVAAVFATELPETWEGVPVHDADEHDLRFLDPVPSVAGLLAKGTAKKDTSGFVIIQ